MSLVVTSVGLLLAAAGLLVVLVSARAWMRVKLKERRDIRQWEREMSEDESEAQ